MIVNSETSKNKANCCCYCSATPTGWIPFASDIVQSANSQLEAKDNGRYLEISLAFNSSIVEFVGTR